jgi:hypothetical protein
MLPNLSLDQRNTLVKSFLLRFGALIVSVLSGFDRLRFRGLSRLLSNPRGVNSYLYQHDLQFKDYAQHARQLTETLVDHTKALAKAEGTAIVYLNSPNTDKEATARDIARQRGLSSGRIAILSCVESCRTFHVRGNERGHIELRAEAGRCQHFYHYFLHEQLGLCYVRLQSWFPFTMRIGINGREWLFRQLQRENRLSPQENLLLSRDGNGLSNSSTRAAHTDGRRCSMANRRHQSVVPRASGPHTLYWVTRVNGPPMCCSLAR